MSPPSGVRGGAPQEFEINAFQRLRTPVSLSFLSSVVIQKSMLFSSDIALNSLAFARATALSSSLPDWYNNGLMLWISHNLSVSSSLI